MSFLPSIGDKVIYPGAGLAEVVGLEEKEVSGVRGTYYSIKIEYTGVVVTMPRTKVETNGVRKPVEKGEVQDVIATLRDHDTAPSKQPWVRRFRSYQEKIGTGMINDLAEVFRDLTLTHRGKGTLSFGERRLFDTVRRLLVSEMAHALGKREGEVEDMLIDIFNPKKSAGKRRRKAAA